MNFILSNSSGSAGKWSRVVKFGRRSKLTDCDPQSDMKKYDEVLEISRERIREAQTFRIIFAPLLLANFRLLFNKVGSKVGWVWQVSSRFYSHGTQTSSPPSFSLYLIKTNEEVNKL